MFVFQKLVINFHSGTQRDSPTVIDVKIKNPLPNSTSDSEIFPASHTQISAEIQMKCK